MVEIVNKIAINKVILDKLAKDCWFMLEDNSVGVITRLTHFEAEVTIFDSNGKVSHKELPVSTLVEVVNTRLVITRR
jgi:hypothetical protein